MEKQDELNARIAAEIMRWRLPEDPDQPRAWLEWSEADLRYVWSGWWAQEPEMDEDDRGESIVRMDYAVAETRPQARCLAALAAAAAEVTK